MCDARACANPVEVSRSEVGPESGSYFGTLAAEWIRDAVACGRLGLADNYDVGVVGVRGRCHQVHSYDVGRCRGSHGVIGIWSGVIAAGSTFSSTSRRTLESVDDHLRLCGVGESELRGGGRGGGGGAWECADGDKVI